MNEHSNDHVVYIINKSFEWLRNHDYQYSIGRSISRGYNASAWKCWPDTANWRNPSNERETHIVGGKDEMDALENLMKRLRENLNDN